MKVLLFGRSGQVATEIRRQAPVIALGRAEADLGNPLQCAEVIAECDADVVINAAAFTAVDQAEKEELLATTINGDAPAAMSKAAARRGIPFLHISSDYVFNGAGQTPWTEGDPCDPLGAYGRSKLAGELGVAVGGGSFGILRTSWVFSAHGNNFVKTMLRLGRERRAINVVDDQIGGPTPASDIAACLLAMAREFHSGTARSGIYHFSGAPDVSWLEFAREIFRQSGLSVETSGIPSSSYPTPATRPLNSRLNCALLCDEFGVARPDWRQGLARVLHELSAS